MATVFWDRMMCSWWAVEKFLEFLLLYVQGKSARSQISNLYGVCI